MSDTPRRMTFTEAQRLNMEVLLKDIQASFEYALINDCRPRPRFVPCPEHIGNDPCDDWSLDDDYDY